MRLVSLTSDNMPVNNIILNYWQGRNNSLGTFEQQGYLQQWWLKVTLGLCHCINNCWYLLKLCYHDISYKYIQNSTNILIFRVDRTWGWVTSPPGSFTPKCGGAMSLKSGAWRSVGAGLRVPPGWRSSMSGQNWARTLFSLYSYLLTPSLGTKCSELLAKKSIERSQKISLLH